MQGELIRCQASAKKPYNILENITKIDKSGPGPGAPDLTAVGAARALIGQARVGEAAALLAEALQATPSSWAIQATLGEALCRLGRHRDAIAHLQEALAQDPGHAPSHFFLGTAYHVTENAQQAFAHLKRAIKLSPRMTDAYRMLASVLQGQKMFPDAVAVLDLARANGAASGQTEALCFYLRQMLADWSMFEQSIGWLRAFKTEQYSGLDPAIVHTVPGMSPEDQREIAATYGRRFGGKALPPPNPIADPTRKIRLGYLSSDFYDHPVGRHVLGILENHDRSRFELFAYSLSSDKDDDTARRLRAASQQFADLRSLTDDQAAALIRRDEIEILIDLGGYTEGARPGLPSRRAAPVQTLYLGMGGTTGLPHHDYLITDRVISPPRAQPHYSETFAYLPETLFNADHGATFPERRADRSAWGLPNDAFVFAAFNNTWKLTPDVFRVWMDILRAVPTSVLWMRKIYPTSSQRMQKEAAAQGIDPQRLIFCMTADRDEHLTRLASADLFLDTLPYGAGSTAADALWSGLPILTCTGETYVSGMCASQVMAMGAPELVVPNMESYRARAIEMATDPGLLADARARIAANRSTSVLFDSPRFTRQLEGVLTEMSRRHRAGVPHTTPIAS